MRFVPALLALPLLASAVPTSRLVVQQDLVDQLVIHDETANWSMDLNELRLVQFSDDEPAVWITEREKIAAKAEGKRFMDITETPTLGFSGFMLPTAANAKYEYPQPGNYTKAIKSIVNTIELDDMKAFLKKFSSFRTRYYRSDTGKQSQQWLMSQLKDIAKGHKGMSVKEFPHTWGQNSLIVRIEPADKKMASAPVTIVGAHQDSTNLWPFLPAPGADDDGSGTTSSITALRALAHANFTPTNPVEFHYYSAEEGGLLGSQAIAKSYEDAGTKVLAMLQMDMTAWVKAGTEERVGIIEDFVDPALTEFMEGLVAEYLDIPSVRTKCGYACSDHASFLKAGYQSSFAIESSFEDSNHNIHSTSDTIDHPEFSFSHMREFSKLVVAFAVELGGLE